MRLLSAAVHSLEGCLVEAVDQRLKLFLVNLVVFIPLLSNINGEIAEEPVAVTYVYDQINAGKGVAVADNGCYLFVLKIELVGAAAENAVWTIQPYAMGTDGETMYYGQAFTYAEGADAPIWVTESN